MKLVIDRERWIRGDHPNPSMLLRSDDSKMCCLGFYLTQCGAGEEAMLDLESPSAVEDLPTCAAWLIDDDDPIGDGDSELCAMLMDTNDASSLDEPLREARLAELFAKQGVEVEFV